jgi:PadR family transcriptional regulator, regulatory protein AphA
MAKARPLTTTSYAILGLLSLRPWTTYELAQQMQRALGQFWPRAESKLYEEPKKLVAHGFATATVEHVGKRARTVYDITPAGRDAVGAWMPQPSAGPVIEFEGLVRVFFAEHGTKADVLAAIGAAHACVDRRYEEGQGISRSYLEGEGGFPERLPWLILIGHFFEEMVDAVDRWAAWATTTVEGWPDDLTHAEPDLDALEAMAAKWEAHRR